MHSPNSEDDDLEIFLNVFDNLRARRWLDALVGVGVWVFLLLLLVIGSPIAAIVALYDYLVEKSLKFRRYLADKIRPKDVTTYRNPEPHSDLVAKFVEYEQALVAGKETLWARLSLISALSRVEGELEQHRLLSAEVRKLRVEDERPRRRDAILDTRIRAERRRERSERNKGTE